MKRTLKSIRIGKLFVVLSLLFANTGIAQDSLNISLTSNLIYRWERAVDIKIHDGFAYLACYYDGLWILDIDDPEDPQYVTRILSGENVRAITIENDIAYVYKTLPGRHFIILFDISDPSQPEELSTIEVANVNHSGSTGPEVSNGYLYLGVRIIVDDEMPHFLGIWDIRDPANPELISGPDDAPELSDVVVDGDRLYGIYDHRYLRAYDISDPHNIERLGYGSFVGDYHNLDVFGGFIYGYLNTGDSKLSVFDPSDPENIEEVWSTEEIQSVSDMVEVGDYLYLQRGPIGNRNHGLTVLHIADPSTPEISRIYVNDGTISLSGIATDGELLYSISSSNSQFRIWNIDDPMDSFEIYISHNPGGIHDVEISNDIVYTTYLGRNGIGIELFTIDNPNDPNSLGTTIVLQNGRYPTSTMFGSNMIITGSGNDGKMVILDMENPAQPELISEIQGDMREVDIEDNIAYLAAGEDGLQIYDLSNPAEPEELAVIPVGRYATDVRVEGDWMFYTDIGPNDTAWVVDISDPGNPHKNGYFNNFIGRNYLGIDITDRSLVSGPGIRVRDLRDEEVAVIEGFNSLWSENSWEMMFLNDTLLARIDTRKGLSIYKFTGEAPNYDSCNVVGYYEFDWGSPVALAFDYPWLVAAGKATVAMFDLRAIYGDTLEENSIGDMDVMIRGMSLSEPYPNPFNSTVTLNYSLATPAHISIQIYDLSGRLIEDLVDRHIPSGIHTITWLADGYSTGMYIVKMETEGFSQIRKIILTK